MRTKAIEYDGFYRRRYKDKATLVYVFLLANGKVKYIMPTNRNLKLYFEDVQITNASIANNSLMMLQEIS